ncbi:unnamed protein product [Leptidea sinapis]|uniref:Uncharacterized protein n=1 Tax=Leptidea sinapis TaxID=189913 RepID=A0A5E4QPQ4_9NEOP|nr:unnamed protein product [Leptidea sinapis]
MPYASHSKGITARMEPQSATAASSINFGNFVQAAYQENLVVRETEERARRAREARAAAERDRRDRQHRYKQFVDMDHAQEGVMDRVGCDSVTLRTCTQQTHVFATAREI